MSRHRAVDCLKSRLTIDLFQPARRLVTLRPLLAHPKWHRAYRPPGGQCVEKASKTARFGRPPCLYKRRRFARRTHWINRFGYMMTLVIVYLCGRITGSTPETWPIQRSGKRVSRYQGISRDHGDEPMPITGWDEGGSHVCEPGQSLCRKNGTWACRALIAVKWCYLPDISKGCGSLCFFEADELAQERWVRGHLTSFHLDEMRRFQSRRDITLDWALWWLWQQRGTLIWQRQLAIRKAWV